MFLLVQIIDDERQRLLCVQGLYVAIEQMPPEIYISQQDSLRQAYFYRKLYHFAYLLGSAEIESTSDDFRDRAYRITATPLLSQSVQFQFGVAPIFLTRRSSYKTVKTKTGIFCAGP